MNENEPKAGDTVQIAIVVFNKYRVPTISNFYSGKIIEVYEDAKNYFYVRLDNVDKLIPINIGSNRIK